MGQTVLMREVQTASAAQVQNEKAAVPPGRELGPKGAWVEVALEVGAVKTGYKLQAGVE